MGRFMGLEGDYLLEDIKEGGWRKHKYETSTLRDVPNDNWFPIKNFVEHVDRIGIR
jgi:hypothetical protein